MPTDTQTAYVRAAKIVDRAIAEGRILPIDRNLHISAGIRAMTPTETFSAGSSDMATQQWEHTILSRPAVHPVAKPAPSTGGLTALQRGILDSEPVRRTMSPERRAKLLGAGR